LTEILHAAILFFILLTYCVAAGTKQFYSTFPGNALFWHLAEILHAAILFFRSTLLGLWEIVSNHFSTGFTRGYCCVTPSG
jgi:hypothetical protein